MLSKIISKYCELYKGRTYSSIADLILESELNIKAQYSHRTLRRYISEYINSQNKECLCNTPDKCIAENNCNISKLSNYVSKPIQSRPDTIPWNQERVEEYFKNTPYYIEDRNKVNEIPKELAQYPLTPSECFKVGEDSTINKVDFTIPRGVIQNQVKEELKTYIVLGCIHFPFHNKPFWNATLKFIKELGSQNKLQGIILNGDILDMHSISRFNKGKITIPGLTLSEEYMKTNIELDKLDKILKESKIDIEKHYLYGNHEMWYSQYMSESDNSKLGKNVVKSPREALYLDSREYKIQEDYKTAYVTIGDTEVHHGSYIAKHAAFAHANTMRRSNVFNHTHRIGSYVEGNVFSYNLGWMGDKNASVFGYMDRIQKEAWSNGFGLIHVDSKNQSHVEQIIWKNNSFIYSGKIYK